MSERIEPVPGDPSTEPVATAAQSHVDGRVGPPTIAQDATAVSYAPADVEQIQPGAVLPADTPPVGGPIAGAYAGPEDRPASAEGETAADAAAADPSLLGQNAAAEPATSEPDVAEHQATAETATGTGTGTGTASGAGTPAADSRG